MRVQRLLQLSLTAALTLALSGCGRTYHIKGRVIFLPQLQSSAGFIVEFTGKDFPRGGEPIAGAREETPWQDWFFGTSMSLPMRLPG